MESQIKEVLVRAAGVEPAWAFAREILSVMKNVGSGGDRTIKSLKKKDFKLGAA